MAEDIPQSVVWRTGRKVGRTIYAQIGPEPSYDDVLIGVMDTPELAAEVVRTRSLRDDEATFKRAAEAIRRTRMARVSAGVSRETAAADYAYARAALTAAQEGGDG